MAGEAEKEVYDATKRGDLATFQDVLENDQHLVDGASFAYSRNLLHIATIWEQTAIVEEVLRRNPKLAEDFDSNNSSPLHIAAAKGNFEIASKLLAVAPEMCWSLDCQGMNPIHIAAKNGHLQVMEYLLEVNPSPAMERLNRGQTVLHLCVKHGQHGALQVLVERLGELVQEKDDDGETLLHWALRCNQLEIAYMLLPLAPEMCWLVDSQGMNLIHIAAMNGHLDVLKTLVELNFAPAMERVYRGQTVLHLCVKHGHLMVLKFLVEKLGDVISAKDDDGETILHWAVRFDQLEMVRYLVKKTKVDVGAKNSMGYSPLDVIAKLPSNRTSQMKKIFRNIELVEERTPGYTNSMMIILGLIATVTFQAAISPPGGVWQDDSSTHKAGEAIMASISPVLYESFINLNMMALLVSLTVMCIFVLDSSLSSPIFSAMAKQGFMLAFLFMLLSYETSVEMIVPNSIKQIIKPLVFECINILLLYTMYTVSFLRKKYRFKKH